MESKHISMRSVLCIFTDFGFAQKTSQSFATSRIEKFFRNFKMFALLGDVTPSFFATKNKFKKPVQFWHHLARNIYKEYKKYDGIVVVVEPESILYSAIAMVFSFYGLRKPIIFTSIGASSERFDSAFFLQSNIGRSADLGAHAGFLYTVQLATTSINGVWTSFHHQAYPVLRATKMNGRDVQLFLPDRFSNDPSVFDLDTSLIPKITYSSSRMLTMKNEFSSAVEWLALSPNVSPALAYEKITSDIRVIILDVTFFGSLTSEWIAFIRRYPKIIFILYSSVEPASDMYHIPYLFSSPHIAPETLYIKISWLLSYYRKVKDIRRFLYRDLRGELRDYS